MMLRLRNMIQDEQVEIAICIILRLPGLFLLDSYYQMTQDTEDEEQTFIVAIPRAAHILIVFVALIMITLPMEHLITFYMHLLSATLLAVSKAYSLHYVIKETSEPGNEAETGTSTRNFEALLFHICVSAAITSLLDLEGNSHRTLLAAYTLPPSARIVGAPVYCLPTLHFCANITIGVWFLSYVLVKLPDLFAHFVHLYRFVVFGGRVFYVPVIVWQQYYLMQQLFIFWCLLVVVQLYNYCNPQAIGGSPRGALLLEQEWYLMLLYAVSEVCASPFSLAASCIAVTYIARFVLLFTNVFAQGKWDSGLIREHPRAGVGEGITMALLSLQTGMTRLAMPQRVGAMSVVLFIVLGSLIQSMHEMTEPLLMRLCASRNVSKFRHIRLLFLCLFLLTFPLYMTYFLCSLFKVDFWALVVVSTCALTSVQVAGSIVVYCLFMFDNLYKDSSWEALDDLVYYARAVTRVLEFLVAVLVVGAGFHESVLMTTDGQPWSWVNSSVLLVHCYYNVYLRLQSGWQSFLLRREASRRVGGLPVATCEQLAARAHDVCPVCYIEMTSACVTPCQHLFHPSCLRKWLYVQDSCPLCSSRVIDIPKVKNETSSRTPDPIRAENQSQKVDEAASMPSNCAPEDVVNSSINNASDMFSEAKTELETVRNSNSEAEVVAETCTSMHRRFPEEVHVERNNNFGSYSEEPCLAGKEKIVMGQVEEEPITANITSSSNVSNETDSNCRPQSPHDRGQIIPFSYQLEKQNTEINCCVDFRMLPVQNKSTKEDVPSSSSLATDACLDKAIQDEESDH
ncbi:RING finger protein 145-like [Schistocerca cancellata]|uniref:RING finger protein 145-like n=1 Tax=Schistocerca cancellata TaxID=274614 RepID=UPI0021197851|nr:RING finger protein 145-like [Schistocerca cancellata]